MWATDQRSFTSSTVPSAGTTETIGNISITFGSSSSTFSGKEFTCDGTKYGLKGTKNQNDNLDNHIPTTGENFYLNLSTYYPGRMSVIFYNSDSSDPRGLTCYRQSTSNSSDVTSMGSEDASASSMGTLEFDMEPGYNYYVYSVSGAPIYHEISFTPETKTNSVEYSHTWVFNYGENNWPNTVGAMLTANSKWDTGGFGSRYQYTGTVNTSGGDALYDGNGNLVEETRGLKFSATSASNIQTDLHYDLMLKNGASVIIPSAKIGQTVSIWGWWPSGKTISVTNAKTSDNATSVTGTGDIAEFVFAVTANADVTITVSDDNFFFYSISINKSELTTFAHNINGNETFYGLSTPSSSEKIGGAFIGKTTTFQYKVGRDQVLRTRVDIAPGLDVTGITVNSTNFTLTSNNNNILDPTSCDVSSYNATTYHKFNYGSIKVKKPGTASLTYSFNGTDAYNAKDYTELFTIEKDDIDLTFASDFVVKTVGDVAFTNTFTLNGLTLPVTDEYAGTINTSSFTYEVKTVNDKQTSSIVSVSSTGVVTLSSPGAVLIHAKLASTDWYNGVDRKYTLVVNPSGGTSPVLQWSDVVSGGVNVQYNDAVSHTATGTVGDGQTIKYRSADTSVASVDATGKVTGTGVGSTTIYAYVEPTSTHNYAEISYSVTVTSAGELESFRFIPNNGKVNNGKSITPKLAFPTIPGDGVNSLEVTKIQVLERNGSPVSEPALTADDAIAACDIIGVDNASNLKDNWILNADGKVNKVNVTINGKTVGKAEITVTFKSDYYNDATATYTVEVTAAGTRNFSWADGDNPEYYVYAGDFMMLPAISGNSNGNNNYSNGEKNSKSYLEGGSTHSALHAYVYERKNGNIKWNEKNLKIGEGFPDFEVINGTGSALMFFSKGQGSSHADSLMVFCETEGDVTLRAYDPQDHAMYCDATIHILPVANLASAETSAGVTFPYTWDFTTNFDMTSLAGNNEHYWIPMKSGGEPTGAYTNGLGFFDIDWADVNSNGSTDERNYKYFVAGASNSNVGYMPQFNGMKIKLQGTSSYANKIDRLRILNYEEGKGRLQFSGGDHILYLPLPDTKPSTYRVYVRAEGVGTSYVYINEDESTKQTIPSGTPTILYFESSAISGDLRLSFNNARVYWIACSTEPKNVVRPTSTNSNLTYASASYSYNEDLDLSKSGEVNDGVTAYYASSYSYDAKAEATGTEGFAVVLTPITTKVPANTGLILKKITTEASTSCYMIANGKNKSSYEAPTALTTNYLKATPTAGGTISSTETKDQTTYTNFTMAYAYKMYRDPTDAGTAYTDYLFDRDWSFYRIMGNVSFSGQKSYLQIPGNLYVNKDGEIVVAGSRRATSDNRPSTKAMLDIIYEDEPLNDSGTTGISIVSDQEAFDNDGWYTLQGVRVNTPAKGGIYIHHGKKYVIK